MATTRDHHFLCLQIMWFDGEPGQPSKAVDVMSLDRIKYPELKTIVADKFVVHPELPTPPIIEHMMLPLQQVSTFVAVTRLLAQSN